MAQPGFSDPNQPFCDSRIWASQLGATGVGLAPGAAFGAGGEDHLRLCFAATLPTLERAVARFTEFLTSAERSTRSRPAWQLRKWLPPSAGCAVGLAQLGVGVGGDSVPSGAQTRVAAPRRMPSLVATKTRKLCWTTLTSWRLSPAARIS